MTTDSRPRLSPALIINIWVLRFTRNWLRIVLTILGVFTILPILAPVLMRAGATEPAQVIYTLYGPFCHQFAFRSAYLFGEQGFYPRAISDSPLTPYEVYISAEDSGFDAALNQAIEFHFSGTVDQAEAAIAGFDPYVFSPLLQFASRYFFGNEQMGYKMAICARDIGTYSALFGGGLLFAIPFVRRRVRPVPILLYLFLGLGPIGLDGTSQLLSYPPFELWPPRETEPAFRVVTGALCGFMNAWLGFPYLNLSIRDTRERLEVKLARAGIKV
ncbi:MAG: DUF2085 domain-containing protein [Chloroflexi bacterium]|nr:DUF2085 domain-containing protein [Chloroflexota bacterium]